MRTGFGEVDIFPQTDVSNWISGHLGGSQGLNTGQEACGTLQRRQFAEHFTYNLKMLRRATIVGETTGGANHAGVLHNLDEHFAIGIPEHRPVNPYPAKDWAFRGVEPDIKVKATDALGAAERLAETKLRGR